MQEMYFKRGKRYYPTHQLPNPIGFPANGVFLVNEGYEQIADTECIDEIGLGSVIDMSVLVYSFNKVMDVKLGFEQNIDIFLDLKELKFDVDESIKVISRDDFYDLYVKKGTTYKKIAETFNSFTSKGLYIVKDGMNNGCQKIEIMNKIVTFKFNKALVKSQLMDHIANNPVSYLTLIRKAAKLIILNKEINK